jgi:flavin-dependent dehydrogenase
MHVSFLENDFHITTPWVVDASGRSRVLSKLLHWKDLPIHLQTGSRMAHFKHIQPNEKWDTPENTYWDSKAIALRKFSTTHLMRPSSWWWIIRLDETTTSIGVMFDKTKVKFDDPEAYFKELINNDPELSRMTTGAEMGSIRYIEQVPYVSEKLFEPGIALIGDSGAFLDPLFSPGLELIGQQALWLSEMFVNDKKTSEFDRKAWNRYQIEFLKAYETRITMYQIAYGIMGSYDLFTTWTKLGNFVYLSRIVYPSVVFKSRLKRPLRFTVMERIAVEIIGGRLNRIYEKRSMEGRTSRTSANHLTYSGVRVPKNYRFVFIPLILFVRALSALVKIERLEISARKQK